MTMRVFVPRDAAAVACGADDVAVVIAGAAREIRADVRVVRNGSRGMLWLEPLVEVEVDGVRYGFGPVDVASARELIAAGLLDPVRVRNIAHETALGPVDEIDFFKRQTRLTFAERGEWPAIFVANADGSESLTNFHAEGTTAVIHRVAARFVLRRGRLTGCIENRGYAGSGAWVAGGALDPASTRAVRP